MHEGIDSTLVMLRERLEPGIEVARRYADDLLPIDANGSELNQVWTNVLGNAIDATGGQGSSRSRPGPTATASWSR